MDLAFTEEQDELRRTIKRFVEDRAPVAEVRRLMETPEGYDDVVWKQMGEELALQGIHVPEAYGGQGFGFVELGSTFGSPHTRMMSGACPPPAPSVW